MRNYEVRVLGYIQTAKNLEDPFTKVYQLREIYFIELGGFETDVSYHGGNPTYVIGDPMNKKPTLVEN